MMAVCDVNHCLCSMVVSTLLSASTRCTSGLSTRLWPCPHVQVLSVEEKPFEAPEPSPFRGDNGGELAPVAHKYRRVALGGDQTLIVRCEVRRSRHAHAGRAICSMCCAARS